MTADVINNKLSFVFGSDTALFHYCLFINSSLVHATLAPSGYVPVMRKREGGHLWMQKYTLNLGHAKCACVLICKPEVPDLCTL